MDVEGRPLLGRVLDRLRRLQTVPIVVCTSTDRSDDAIETFAENEGVGCFRGPLHDVAQRAFLAAEKFGFERFARVCGDRPFLDPGLIASYRRIATEEGDDLVTNVVGQTYAPGLTTEIVLTDALARLLAKTQDPEDREHVTRYFYRAPEFFRIRSMQAPNGNYRGTRLVVDTEEDLRRASSIARALKARPNEETPERIVEYARAFDRANNISI